MKTTARPPCRSGARTSASGPGAASPLRDDCSPDGQGRAGEGGERGAPGHCQWGWASVQTPDAISTEARPEIKNGASTHSGITALGYVPRRRENGISKRRLLSRGRCSTVHSSRDAKQPHVPQWVSGYSGWETHTRTHAQISPTGSDRELCRLQLHGQAITSRYMK